MAALDALPQAVRQFIQNAARQHSPVVWLAVFQSGVSEHELLARLKRADTL